MSIDIFLKKFVKHNLWMGEWGCDWDGFICVSGIDPNEIWQFMIEAQEQAND